MFDRLERQDWRAAKVRDWVLAIVRFAVTLHDVDKHAVLALAEDMDGLGSVPGAASFSFFRHRSSELCRAIADRDKPDGTAILRRHLETIDDRRLRRVTAAAVDLEGACHARLSKERAEVQKKPRRSNETGGRSHLGEQDRARIAPDRVRDP
jgi:hypothetical protein